MKILIIGGSGLISTSITRLLTDRGADLTLFNRGVTPVRGQKKFKLLTGDRSRHQDFEAQLKDNGPWDCVVDMICSDPADAASLIRACRNITEQLIFCSTTNVYPKPADHYPVNENHRPGAAFKNGIDKAECERLLKNAEADGCFKLTIIRPGHTYAEGGAVLHSLGNNSAYLDRVRSGKPVIVHGDGSGLWSALHADDVARIFVAAIGNSIAYAQTYNACGEEWMTWDQYQLKIARAMNVKVPEIIHVPTEILSMLSPLRAVQCQRSLQYPGIYDMDKARKELIFQQHIPFTEGIRRVVQYLEESSAIESWQNDPEYDQILHNWLSLRKQITTSPV